MYMMKNKYNIFMLTDGEGKTYKRQACRRVGVEVCDPIDYLESLTLSEIENSESIANDMLTDFPVMRARETGLHVGEYEIKTICSKVGQHDDE